MKCKRSSYTSEKPGRSIRSKAGITIVEVLVSLAIFVVYLTGACKLIVSHRKILDSSRDRYTASNIAKNRYEMTRTMDFSQIPLFAEAPRRVNANGVFSSSGNYLRETTINTVQSNLYEVVVSVSYLNRKTLKFDTAPEEIRTFVSADL